MRFIIAARAESCQPPQYPSLREMIDAALRRNYNYTHNAEHRSAGKTDQEANIMLWNIIVTILVGALVGWLACKLMNLKNGFWMNALLGIIGSAVGRLLAGLIGIHANTISIGGIAISVAGACLVVWLARKLVK